MNENKLKEYAKLIVKIGANVQEGQVVRLQVGVDQVPLAKLVTEECYKAGAKRVELFWSCGEINKLDYQYASAEVLGEVSLWEEERMKQMTDAITLFNLVFEKKMETQVNEHRTEQEILFLCHSVHPRIRIVGGLHHCRWVLYRAKPR